MICDVCSSPTTAYLGTGYTADEFRRLVSMGFEPPEIVKAGGPKVISDWKNILVAGSSTAWMLCPTCAARASRYMHKSAGSGMEGMGATESWESILGNAALRDALPQSEPAAPQPPPFIPYAPLITKNRLRGFARGWTIFMIVYCSADIASLLPYINNHSKYWEILIPPLLCLIAMIVGAAKILKAKPHGLWIMITASFVMVLLSGLSIGNVTLITGGGFLFVLLTWVFTRKEINYGRKKETK